MSERYFNQQLPSKRLSPFYKKLLSEGGGAIDLAGRALSVFSFAVMFVKPVLLPLPSAFIELGVGVIAVLWGSYLKAEAER